MGDATGWMGPVQSQGSLEVEEGGTLGFPWVVVVGPSADRVLQRAGRQVSF